MPAEALYIGLDLGTSGARAVAIDDAGAVHAEGKAATGPDRRAPAAWWAAAEAALTACLATIPRDAVRGLAVDGTSGTMVAVDAANRPLGPGVMYNDPCEDTAILDRIDAAAARDSAARGASSALARAIALSVLAPDAVLHQADWIAARLSGTRASDANNALKTGYDPVTSEWPAWIADTGMDPARLPPVLDPGTPAGTLLPAMADRFGLPRDMRIVAGTTDGCASFLATGASAPGDGVTALGTTLTIKLLSDRPVFAPAYGIYSHKVLGLWLAGGASNTGGAVLLEFFDPDTIAALSQAIDPETDTGLDYYPLTRPGERFPIADPMLQPRLAPRPTDDTRFLQALLEGIAGVEALAYARLAELGAPDLRCVRSVGGGARNPAWTRLRERRLGVPMAQAHNTEAAYGAALLARRGAA